jgi:formylglycine-generating enzyme required for sulfatase activity
VDGTGHDTTMTAEWGAGKVGNRLTLTRPKRAAKVRAFMKAIRPLCTALLFTAALAPGYAVDFVTDVQPILEFNCVRCHNPKATDYEKGDTDLDLSTFKTATDDDGTIVAGKAEKSKLYTTTVLADDAKKLMPPKNRVTGALERLAKTETEILKNWINEGAKWPEGVTLTARKKEEKGGDEVAVSARVHARIMETAKAQPATEMKEYTVVIPGTEVSFTMLPIAGGKFKMGSPDGEKDRRPDEGPQHEVEIAPFWMEKCEVTWGEFELFMYPAEEKKVRELKKLPAELNALTDAITHPTQPYVEMSFGMGKDGYPAISMTQHAANKYCQWLSAKTGHFYRLPTEAEWEYAARAGTTTAYFWGDDAAPMNEYAWSAKNSDFKYQKVGRKKANPWGLHDILGNVMEWTLDQYDPEFYKNSPAANPWNKATKPYPHVARGGSWDDEAPGLRAAARRASNKSWKVQDPQLPKSVWYHTDAQFLGFRVVRPLKAPTADEAHACWNSGVEKDNPLLKKAE